MVMPPWDNIWLLLAMGLSMILHFLILYVKFFAVSTNGFGVTVSAILPSLISRVLPKDIKGILSSSCITTLLIPSNDAH